MRISSSFALFFVPNGVTDAFRAMCSTRLPSLACTVRLPSAFFFTCSADSRLAGSCSSVRLTRIALAYTCGGSDSAIISPQ